jgi:hypothetical protein
MVETTLISRGCHMTHLEELEGAIEALWRMPTPGPSNLMSAPEFVILRDICLRLYPNAQQSKGALGVALSNALQGLSLPCMLSQVNTVHTQPSQIVAAALDAAFQMRQASRMHLCPLDLAGNLPYVAFGPNRIQTFTPSELSHAVDLLRLQRMVPYQQFDAVALSRFDWLIVEETYTLDQGPGQRAMPIFFEMIDFNRDWGRIEPHRARFPRAVEAALFAVLLAPWENWVDAPDFDWRAFRVPWTYTADTDLFVRPQVPPSPQTLSWEPDVIYDHNGNIVEETERPIRLPLKDSVSDVSNWLNDMSWAAILKARSSCLFETPVAHFFIHDFLADAHIDEFLAHITTIEAALGLRSDYGGTRRSKSGTRIRLRATDRVATRVSVLLNDNTSGDQYRRLFEHRSAFLHGRAMDPIPGEDRIVARTLACRVVNGLVEAALKPSAPVDRETYLNELLDCGLQ